MIIPEADVFNVDVNDGEFLSEKRSIRFNFHNFAGLPHSRGHKISSPSLPCHGHQWKMELYPRGDSDSSEEVVHVSAFLGCETNKVVAGFALRVISAGHWKESPRDAFCDGLGQQGWNNFLKRDIVLNPANDFLINGTLTIEVDIQVYVAKPDAWTFHKTPQPEMLKMLDEWEDFNADVTFAVGENKFQAQLCMLNLHAPGLKELAEECPKQDVPIDDVDPSIFEVMLRFAYSHQLPKDYNLKKNAKTLLSVADKYGCSSMKLFAEAALVETAITVDTAAELLLFADSHNCALLKEAVVCFFVRNKDEVFESEGFSQVEESPKLLVELLKAEPTALVHNESQGVNRMFVASLRKKLDEAGHDVDAMDGTREMLVERLQRARHKDESGDDESGDSDSGDSDSGDSDSS